VEILLIFFLLLVSLLFLGVPVAVSIAITSIVAWGSNGASARCRSA
jgi:hypothetical protein